MKRIQLLLADEHNEYQMLLVETAHEVAAEHGIELLEPRFADGSVMRQMGHCYDALRRDPRPDGVLVLPVAAEGTESALETLLQGGVDAVILNRVPEYLERLGREFPERLLAAVSPDQAEIGRIQGRQALHLLPDGGSALLVLGARTSPSAVSREEGFRETIGDRLEIRAVEGQWQEERAAAAVRSWLRFGFGSGREMDLVVSQNDAMARGARRALERRESEGGRAGLAEIPILGCDGLPDEGLAMVRTGELTATVVMPPSSPRAVEILDAFWQRGEVLARETLAATPWPPIEDLEPLHRRGGA